MFCAFSFGEAQVQTGSLCALWVLYHCERLHAYCVDGEDIKLSTLTYGHVKVKPGRLVMYKQVPCDLKLLVLAYLNTRKALRGLRT